MGENANGLEKKMFRCVIYCFEIKMTGRRNDDNLTKQAIKVSLDTLKQSPCKLEILWFYMAEFTAT